MNRVPLVPLERHACRRAAFLARDRCAAALEALQQTAHVGRGTDSDQQMDVRTDHADLWKPGRLLRGDAPQKTTQEPSQRRVDQGLAVSGSPDDVAIDAIDHGRNPATGFLSERHRISAGWARFGPPAASGVDWRPSGSPLGAARVWKTTPRGVASELATVRESF